MTMISHHKDKPNQLRICSLDSQILHILRYRKYRDNYKYDDYDTLECNNHGDDDGETRELIISMHL